MLDHFSLLVVWNTHSHDFFKILLVVLFKFELILVHLSDGVLPTFVLREVRKGFNELFKVNEALLLARHYRLLHALDGCSDKSLRLL